MQVKELNQSILKLPDWAQFLQRSNAVLAVVLLGSALIMAIAANWLSWPKVGRIALLQLTITALVLLAWKFAKSKPKDWARAYSLSSLTINLAAIAIGGLLALIGQSYQTGADPWQLFALWAVLLLPWLIVLRSLFIILLVLTLTNIALFLFYEGFGLRALFGTKIYSGYLLIVLNGMALVLSHWLKNTFYDPYLVVRRFSLAALVLGVYWCQWQAWNQWDSSPFLQNILSLAGLLALTQFYLRSQHDVLAGAVAYMGVYALAVGLILVELLFVDREFFLIFMLCAAIGAGIVFDLYSTWKKLPKSEKTTIEPWFLRAASLVIQSLVALFFLIMMGLAFHGLPPLLGHVYLVLTVVGVVYLQRKTTGLIQRDFSLFLLLSGMAIGAVSVELDLANIAITAWLILLNAVVYVYSSKAWLVRFCSASMALSLTVLLSLYHLGGDWDVSTLSLVAGVLLLMLVGLTCIMQKKSTWEQALMPLWWASVFLLLTVASAELFAVSSGLLGTHFLAQSSTFVRVFELIAAVVPPVVLVVVLWPHYGYRFSLLCTAALAVLTVGWLLPVPLANMALLGWVWAYTKRDSILFWGSVLLLTAALGQFYYTLSWLLWHKALLLAAGGVWLALGAIWLHRYVYRKKAVSTTEDISTQETRDSRLLYMGLFGGLVAVLLLTGQDVARKEYLLANGEPIVLELAPVDPRSLMQGDYMTLSFAINRQIQAIASNNPTVDIPKNKPLRVYMLPSDQQVSKLIALENPITKQTMWVENNVNLRTEAPAQSELTDLAVLRLNYKDREWRPNGVDAWFFPEGQASYFEAAQYGEFKSNSVGDALLYQMLNQQAQPMAAPAEVNEVMD